MSALWTEAHMHNLDGSESNALIPATKAEVLEARVTILRLHATLHRDTGLVGLGHRQDGWSKSCNRQGEARHLILKNPDQFPEAIVAHTQSLEGKNAIVVMRYLYAMILPLRKRKKGKKGVFFSAYTQEVN